MTPTQPPPAEGDPLLGRVLDGRYRIEAPIARGGMATIYRGSDLRLHRTVAIKVMHPSFASDPGFVERFEREARAAARLNSPYVVGLHDQGNDDGITYLVMEYVPGHTVRDVLRTHGALDPAQALAILDPVLEALAAAHRAGYIHRDIKPENVLISDDGRVKVTDFGLARAIEGGDSGRTHGLLLGTVAYLSPEQVEQDSTDARSDVYSAGILLYELLTGQVPFSAAAPMQVAYKHVHEDVPLPSTIRPSVPPDVDALVSRATRRSPDARFPDAAAFLDQVRTERDRLPPAQPWAPAPTDTIVVPAAAGAAAVAAAGAAAAEAGDDADALEAPGWVNGSSPEPVGIDDGHGTQPTAAPPAPAEGGPGAHVTEVSHGTAPEGQPKVRRSRRTLWVGALALISIGALFAVLFLPALQRVEVPDVLGRSPEEASQILSEAGLQLVEAEEEEYSEDYPDGQIMASDPEPGGSVRTGGNVVVVISRGPERYDVPKLRGLTVEDAQIALAAANLQLGEQSRAYDDRVAEGKIISSSPEVGESVKRDTVVDVTVSRGPEPVTMPDLVGSNGDQAQERLTSLGLTVERSDEFSDSVASGLVISTDPSGGTTAYRGDTVQLVVSKGPPLVTVPNVVGRSEKDARDELKDAGFKVKVNKPLGFVIFGVNSQDPQGGTQAPRGSTVTITVV